MTWNQSSTAASPIGPATCAVKADKAAVSMLLLAPLESNSGAHRRSATRIGWRQCNATGMRHSTQAEGSALVRAVLRHGSCDGGTGCSADPQREAASGLECILDEPGHTTRKGTALETDGGGTAGGDSVLETVS